MVNRVKFVSRIKLVTQENSPAHKKMRGRYKPLINLRICWYCSLAAVSLMRSILFCKMMMCLSFMISMAAKCSDVCGCGHDSFPVIFILILYEYPYPSSRECTSFPI
jgi:hypothetical protein